MKKLSLVFIVMIGFLMMNCSDEEPVRPKISLEISAINTKSTLAKNNAVVVFTDFKISIRDVVFKNDNDPMSNLDTDEVQFRGPYQVDLLDNTDAITQTIGETIVPNGMYKEMRFKFHKDENLPQSDKLFDRSIYIEGTIDGIPFVFWHDTSENLDVGRRTGVMVQNGSVNFSVQFDISQFLNSFHQIDMSQALDQNNDGVIEIYPNDRDGNQDIADKLKDNIKATADLMH